jgi:kynurenine formamidase
LKIIDLSTPIDDLAPEPFPVQVTRIGHEEGAERVGEKFPGEKKIGAETFPGGMFLSHETVQASVHCGTHVDAPWHFGPESEGRPAKKIDEVPLEWCYGDGFVIDMRALPPGAEIKPEDVRRGLEEINYQPKPGDIALIRTGADRYFGTKEYFLKFAGLNVHAAEYLFGLGIRTIGTDAPGLDRPFMDMVADYQTTADSSKLWPVHMLGRKKEYCHIERLANLGALPRAHGFKFACFPVKIKNAGAAWARAVAIFED